MWYIFALFYAFSVSECEVKKLIQNRRVKCHSQKQRYTLHINIHKCIYSSGCSGKNEYKYWTHPHIEPIGIQRVDERNSGNKDWTVDFQHISYLNA